MREYKCLNNQNTHNANYSISPIQDSEIEKIRIWRNQQMKVLRQKKIISPEDQKRYFENFVWPEYLKKKPIQVLLSLNKNGSLIGYGGLVYVDWNNLSSEVSFLLSTERMSDFSLYGEDFKNFLELIKKLAKKQMGLKFLTSETYEFRRDHIKILENSSFKLQHVEEKSISMGNKKYDSYFHICHLERT